MSRRLPLLLVAVTMILSGCSGSSSANSGSGGSKSGSSIGPVTLTYWWWAESDVPGADKWMRQTISLYEKAHPNIHINLDVQATDSLISNFQAAAAAHKGPDLATQWATIPVLSQAWAGAIVPVSNYVPKSELSHWADTSENLYKGKIWGAPLYLIGIPIVYNKTLFRKAGLNPDQPPQSISQFLADCAQLKAHGIIPFALGDKDGAAGAWFWSVFGKGSLNSTNDVKQAVTGKTSFASPMFTNWISVLKTMMDKGYINNDVASIDLNTGFEPFIQGKAAMTMSTDSNIVSDAKTMGESKLGIFRAPQVGSGKLASYYDTTQSSTEMITSWSKHPQQAAQFLIYMHSPARLKALYDQTGAFPADNRFNLNAIKDPLQKQMISWDLNLPAVWLENYVPTQLDTNGVRAAASTIFAGTGTPQSAGQLWERTDQQWRTSNPTELKQFQNWISAGPIK